MKKYKFELLKGSKHIPCPSCQRKTFKPYVYTGTNDIVDAYKYGRCERLNNCGYISYPNVKGSDFEEWTPPAQEAYQAPTPDFIPKKIVESSFSRFEKNTFFMWLVAIFGEITALQLQENYCIGTAKNNGTIFWQKDSQGNFRAGKVMYYQPNGKRNKDKNSWYVHNQIDKNFELVQVFFGEHLTNPYKPIALCESEKTAILMSVFEPQYTWLASGGANMLNLYRLTRLPRLDFISPDNGAFKLWEQQTNIFQDRQMDTRVERAVRDGTLKIGADILDLILKEKGLEKVALIPKINLL